MRNILSWAIMTVVAGTPAARGAMPAFNGNAVNAGSVVTSLKDKAAKTQALKGDVAYDAMYFEIDPASIKNVEITDKKSQDKPIFLPVEPTKPGHKPSLPSKPTIKVEKIINIAERIWSFIEANKPVINATSHFANAVPEGTKHWTELELWQKPEHTLYSFSAKNKGGKKVVDVTYMVLRTTGGSKSGKGKYLTGVTVLPISIKALWGYRFDMGVEIPSVSNVGTVDDPIAAMTMHLTWKIKNNFKQTQGAGVYYLQGDGHYQQLAGPFEVKK